MAVVSTANAVPVKVSVKVDGIPLDMVSARKLAMDLKCSLKYSLGLGSSEDAEDMLEVEVDYSDATPADPPPVTPEDPAPPVKASAEAIAAMTPAEYATAKAAGQI